MFHYNKLNDDILKWDCVNFPTGNRDIDRFEENINQFQSMFLNLITVWMIIRLSYIEALKNRNSKYEIDLLKDYDEDNNYNYVLAKNKCRLLYQ